MLVLYLAQLCLGSYMHFKKPAYPKRHPGRNVVHAFLGISLIALAFYEVSRFIFPSTMPLTR